MVLTKSMEREADQRRPRTWSMKIMYFGDNKTFNHANVVQEYFSDLFMDTFKYNYSSQNL